MPEAAAIDAVQGAWLLPFEILDLTPELPEPVLAVVTAEGAVYRPTEVPGPGEAETGEPVRSPDGERSFAVLARLGGGLEVLPASEAAREPAAALASSCREEGQAWLVRVDGLPESPRARILRGPEPVLRRPGRPRPAALFVDFGMVLARFDRRLFEDGLRLHFGLEPDEDMRRRWTGLRLAFEAGDLETAAFEEEILRCLGLIEADLPLLQRLWVSIMSEKRSTCALIRALCGLPDLAVTVVSNTDPWMIEGSRRWLGLGDLLEGVVASCQDGVRPKHEDASLWKRARELAAIRLGRAPVRTLAVDDIRPWLQRALAEGAVDEALHYRDYPSLRYELGRRGLWLPIERRTPG